ncbi:EthD domain-containing protein [Sphingomonas sp. PAMC 26605]|uniref:EthD domain-containing protein n=1 Tax=Sphingomonas sp. PAMC 26605 TaxID=1112214 RepID=UPI00026CD713|nr:EthD domain-containing protein [Sphingomonas sp. PAMC 26605]
MSKVSITTDYAARDASIAINSYTTVLRRPRVPHEAFATYWRDVHGPLCSRIPGLAWYVQNHFDREQDAHLWPEIDGIAPFADYELDGGVEIGFASADDQGVFNDASSILFADEQNMFAATIAYALPDGSRTLVDRFPDPVPNGDDGADRIHVHFGAAGDDAQAFGAFMTGFAETLAAQPEVLKLRLHLPEAYDNAEPAPPAPNVDHQVPPERSLLAVIELAFETPMTRRAFFDSAAFRATVDGQKAHIAYASAFAVSGVYTYVRDKTLTVAGLRGSRAAQLIERLGANNQVKSDVTELIHRGTLG